MTLSKNHVCLKLKFQVGRNHESKTTDPSTIKKMTYISASKRATKHEELFRIPRCSTVLPLGWDDIGMTNLNGQWWAANWWTTSVDWHPFKLQEMLFVRNFKNSLEKRPVFTFFKHRKVSHVTLCSWPYHASTSLSLKLYCFKPDPSISQLLTSVSWQAPAINFSLSNYVKTGFWLLTLRVCVKVLGLVEKNLKICTTSKIRENIWKHPFNESSHHSKSAPPRHILWKGCLSRSFATRFGPNMFAKEPVESWTRALRTHKTEQKIQVTVNHRSKIRNQCDLFIKNPGFIKIHECIYPCCHLS